MTSIIEVKVSGRGTVRDGKRAANPGTTARCDLCGTETDAVVSVTPGGDDAFACKACLRGRLEAITVATWELRDPGQGGLPWGKVSG